MNFTSVSIYMVQLGETKKFQCYRPINDSFPAIWGKKHVLMGKRFEEGLFNQHLVCLQGMGIICIAFDVLPETGEQVVL